MVPSESSLPLPRQQQQDECYYSVLVKDSNVVTVTTKCSEEKPSMDTLIDGFYNLSHNNDNGEKQKRMCPPSGKYGNICVFKQN